MDQTRTNRSRSRLTTRRLLAVALAGAALGALFPANQTHATDFTWDGEFFGGVWDYTQGSGFVVIKTNWDNEILLVPSIPGAADNVTFGNIAFNNSFNIDLNGSRTVNSLIVNGTGLVSDFPNVPAPAVYTLNNGTLTTSGTTLTKGLTINGSAQLLTNGTTSVTNSTLTLGGLFISNGNVNLSGATITGATNKFSLASGATLTLNSNSKVDFTSGNYNNQAGRTVTINSGEFTTTGGFDNSLGGTLNFNNGALNVSGGVFKPNAGGNYVLEGATSGDLAKLTLGSGSTWTNSGDLYVGNTQKGELIIQDGAQVSNTFGRIAWGSTSSVGTVTVRDAGQWTSTNTLYVGDKGNGTLEIESGGVVNSGTGFLARDHANAIANVTVTGGGSEWNANGYLSIGHLGEGTLNVLNGAVVTNTYSNFGWFADGVGEVLVQGNGSRWEQSSSMTVGRFGQGTVNIENGGYVENTTGVIAEQAGSTGTVTVTGNGSTWNNIGGLYIGGSTTAAGGTGTLNVLTGGIVNAEGLTKIWSSGTLNINGGTYNAQGGFDNDGTLSHTDGTLAISGGVVQGLSPFIDSTSGDPTVQIGLGSTWTNTGDLYVGNAGSGNLIVETDSGRVENARGRIAWGNGSTGTVTVKDGGQWNSANQLYIGDSGNGTLTIESGGKVTSGVGFLAREKTNAVANVTVTGDNSRWDATSYLSIGHLGEGTLNVLNGAVVTNTYSNFGWFADGVGEVLVQGNDSRWEQSSSMTVGRFGQGTVNIENGGYVENTTGVIAEQAGSTGTVTVTGIGSTWNNIGDLYVGTAGTGTLTTTDGGTVFVGDAAEDGGRAGSLTVSDNSDNSNGGGTGGRLFVQNGSTLSHGGSAYLGNRSGEFGYAKVTGTHSTWTNTGELYVGEFGTGTLDVQAGGEVSNTTGVIGRYSGSSGTATITGDKSKWTNTGELYVGLLSGTGTLDVQAGGEVSNTNGYLGFTSGSSGTATITGSGSKWINDGFLTVGDFGTGTLNVQAGGEVSNRNGLIGRVSGSSGTATITGTGSTWNNIGDLYVGTAGTGTLTTTNNGTVFVGNAAEAGGITGSLTVSDSSDNSNGGGTGGRLFVQNGSTLSHGGSAYLGNRSGEFGYAKVTGTNSNTATDSKWTNTGDLYVGNGGTGTLLVYGGGEVSNRNGLIGRFSGSSGTATITGDKSKWTNTSELYVGLLSGTGTLDVQAGGEVSNTNGYLGFTSGSSGTATITGSGSKWINDGFLSVGDFGTGTLKVSDGGAVDVAGNLTLGGTSTLEFTLASISDPLIDVTGNAALGGSLGVDLDAGLTLAAGNAFTLIDIGGTQSGAFSNYAQDDLLGTFNGIDLFLSYTGGDGNDVVAYSLLDLIPGDTDGDGDVDDSDLGTSFANYTGPVGAAGGKTFAQGDTDGDGDVDDSDLGTSFAGYTGPLGPTSVPEPASLTMLALGGLVILRRRRGA